MELIVFFINFLLLILVSSIAITGFFGATRGEIKKQDDGTEKKEGKILMGWYFYWYQKEGEKYKFNEHLRQVLAGCVTCMPTVYGNLIYFIMVFSVDAETLYKSLYFPFHNLLFGIIIVWIGYWLGCSYMCTLLWNKIKHTKVNGN